MKTRVEFRSAKFPPYDGEQEQINPGLWGKRLAEYFKEKLAAKTIQTGEINFEDWGCVLPVTNEPFDLWIGCGHRYGDEDEFLCFIEPRKPFVRKLLKKIDTREQVSRLAEAIGEILATDPDIRDVGWLADEPC